MKKLLMSCLFSSMILSAFGQSTNYEIKGIAEDTLGNALIYATVLLLEKEDSTMVDYTRTEMDGSFQFKDVAIGDHLVKTTYIGYIPLTIDATSTDGKNIDLGILKMTEIGAELMEVVIKAARAPMKMRGDTIEYDASTFKVPEGSSVEDLLRRLPGIEVESDGSINADGKSVSKVTVDGKSFFGSDPKAATKNLPAEGISKVQVFDTKSEEEEITGATSEAQDKTMNLELKEEFKSGGFGKLIAGVGDVDRKELKANYNKFNRKIQFSVVGVGNNTGRNGLSWDDYQDFMGSQSFQFSDGGDYGFGGGFRHMISFGGDSDIESSIRSIFFSGRQNNGFPENYNGGINFNYDHNKTKLSSVYYYNQSGLLSESSGFSDKFFPDFTQNEVNGGVKDDLSRGHRTEIDFEQEIDSLHTIKIKFNGAIISENDLNTSNLSLSRDELLTSKSDFENQKNTSGNLANAMVLLRKKFKKKGRRMGLNVSYLTTELEDNWVQKSNTDFYSKSGDIENSFGINQDNNSIADKSVIKANALFVEPLSKKFFFQTFYNFRHRVETGRREITDVNNNEKALNEFLSRSYENTIGYSRVGSSLRYSHNGVNLTTGLAYQSFQLDGLFSSIGSNPITGEVDKVFNNLIPYVSLNFNPVRNSYVSLSYGRQAQEPSIQQLQPIVDNTNPLYIREGNLALTPAVSNEISGYMSRSYPLSGVRLSLNGSLTIFETQISNEQFVDDNLVTTVRPLNIDGGLNSYASASVNFPIVKNKLTVRTGARINVNNRPTIVNDIRNESRSRGLTPYVRLNITPNQDFSLYINTSLGNTRTTYDLNTSQDQTTKNTSLGIELTSKLVGGFYFNSNFNYNRFQNDRFNLSQDVPILNASIYRHLMAKKMELRMSIYDAFNQNIGFYQGAYGLGISQSTTTSLARYVMVSMTYNLRGMKSDARKDSWW